MRICVTGAFGLVGLSACRHFLEQGNKVVGIDNNMRQVFFGEEGRTEGHREELICDKNYTHKNIDIRTYSGINGLNKDFGELETLFKETKFDAVIHTAAQPSHDKAKDIPHVDFEVNALGTLNMLELTRRYCPKAIFIYTSTNKVYGDNPNKVKLKETEKRYEFADKEFAGFDENTSLDQCLHSLFGVSKTAADLYVQEYGKYFGMNTAVFRLGCITGKMHSSVKLHGFLSYLVKSLIKDNRYEIIGYKGKQVRDQIHADDLAAAMEEVIRKPVKGEVFNLGGGAANSASILELIEIIKRKTNVNPLITYKKEARIGDHICYITDFSKFCSYYPNWKIKRSLGSIIDELIKKELSSNG